VKSWGLDEAFSRPSTVSPPLNSSTTLPPAVGRGEVDGAFALGIAGRWAGDLVLLGLDHVMTSRG
jgi:hypothetical protein